MYFLYERQYPVEVVDMVAGGDRYQYLAELEGRTKKHII